MSEIVLLLINGVLLLFPLIYGLNGSGEEKGRDVPIFRLIRGYLFFLIGFFIIEIFAGVYLRINNKSMNYICIISFLITVLLLPRFSKLEISRKVSYLTIMVIFIVLFFAIWNVFYVENVYLEPINDNELFLIFFILIASIVLPVILIVGIIFYVRRKEMKEEISLKDLKIIVYYFGIALIIFFIISMIFFFTTFDSSVIFSGFLDFSDIGDKIYAIMGSIIFEPFFMVVTAFTAFGAIMRVIGIPAIRFMGNIIMAFMPMLLWLQYFFGEPPTEILSFFAGFVWFAKLFHIVLATALIVFVLSAFTLFTSIVMLTGD